MNWQSQGEGEGGGVTRGRRGMQSEISLMLPTTALGLYTIEEEKPYKRTSDSFPQGQSDWFALKQIKYVSLTKIFSHLLM